MKETTSRHRAPLIPTISTIDQENSVKQVERAPDDGQTICVVVTTVIEIGPGSLETATVRSTISSPTSSLDERNAAPTVQLRVGPDPVE